MQGNFTWKALQKFTTVTQKSHPSFKAMAEKRREEGIKEPNLLPVRHIMVCPSSVIYWVNKNSSVKEARRL